jgi:hypothetical protein
MAAAGRVACLTRVGARSIGASFPTRFSTSCAHCSGVHRRILPEEPPSVVCTSGIAFRRMSTSSVMTRTSCAPLSETSRTLRASAAPSRRGTALLILS